MICLTRALVPTVYNQTSQPARTRWDQDSGGLSTFAFFAGGGEAKSSSPAAAAPPCTLSLLLSTNFSC